MPYLIVFILGLFGVIATVIACAEGISKKISVSILLVTIGLWTWLLVASQTPNTIEFQKIYKINGVGEEDSQIVIVTDNDKPKAVNLNIELGRNIPPGFKAKRTVWNGIYMGISFKSDYHDSLKDTWELVKE